MLYEVITMWPVLRHISATSVGFSLFADRNDFYPIVITSYSIHYTKLYDDVALFVDMCSIAVIGVFLGFVIPKGRIYDGSQKYFLGLHRHQWGDIHLYLSLLLLILLIFHIWFNWKWVVQSTKRYFGDKWKNSLIA